MQTRDLEKYVAEHPFFAGLKSDYVKLISGCAQNAAFNKGEHLFREGDPANQFFLIRFGRIAIDIPVPHGGAITVQTLEPGDIVGWSWLFPPFAWTFDARALELTRVIAMDGACLRGKCDADTALGYDLVRRFSAVIAERLQATRLQLLDVYGTVKG
ncbi:MAG: cyclic nucleotide-binding domain-containing protein [Candidatus Schekmanbacteria bacterium]|nr:cyclic nucleotide-binding domain-containing protein [Candidatus Schekmanbacteria bacterium]